MKKIRIAHNPYLNQTSIWIDMKEIKDGPIHELVNNKRLQVWLANFFPELCDYCNDDALDVSFIGIDQDFNDLEEVVQSRECKVCKIKLKHVSKEHADPDRKVTKLKELFERAKKGPIDDFKSEDIDRAFWSALSPEFEICVVATMSAGKSTLINAILGEDLQPSENCACTATITTIADYDDMQYFQGRVVSGNENSEWIRVNKDILKEWNNDGVAQIEIQGNIPMIKSENTRLVLVDTPGPNNSMNHKHRECTIGAIKDDQKPMVLYVLNATQLSTTDDQTLLSIVSQEMLRGGKQSHDRFIFVVNKIDEFDPEKEDISSNLDKVRRYLESNGLRNPNIYPISARLTKHIREQLNGRELTRTERHDMNKGIELFNEDDNMSMAQYMPLSPTVKKRVNQRIAKAKDEDNSNELAMLNSGVPIIEEVIQEYLIKYALPAKLYDARMSFESILKQHDTLASLDRELKRSIENFEEINLQIRGIEDNLKKGTEAKKFRAEVKKYSWKKSKEYASSVRAIETEFNKQLNELQKQLGEEDMSPKIAESLLKGVQSQASYVISNVQIELDRIIQSEVITRVNELKNDYNRYVQGIIGDIGDVSPVMRELTKSVQMVFDVSAMINEVKETRRVKTGSHYVSTAKWYNPFSWFSKELVDTYEDKDIVNSKALYSKFANELRAELQSNEDKAEKAASEQVESIKTKFLCQMDSIDMKIDALLEQMKQKTSSKQDIDKALKQNESKMQWLKAFKEELDNVLSIDSHKEGRNI